MKKTLKRTLQAYICQLEMIVYCKAPRDRSYNVSVSKEQWIVDKLQGLLLVATGSEQTLIVGVRVFQIVSTHLSAESKWIVRVVARDADHFHAVLELAHALLLLLLLNALAHFVGLVAQALHFGLFGLSAADVAARRLASQPLCHLV